MATTFPPYADTISHWNLDTSMIFLNHGSFGAAPKELLSYQSQLRTQMESQPLRFFMRELPELHLNAKTHLAHFLSCDADDLVFVRNATEGVNTVLSSIPWQKGDRVLITNHGYQACKNSVLVNAQRYGFEVDEIEVPYPYQEDDQIVNAVIHGVKPETRLVLIDHISSPTALYFPIERIAVALRGTNAELLVDGAHAPGMIPLDVTQTGAQYYTGNCHKWLCAPKGAAFLWIHKEYQSQMNPLNISKINVKGNTFQDRFYWGGTQDVTPFLSIPKAIETLPNITGKNISELMETNISMSREVVKMLCQMLEQPIPVPENRITNMCSIPLPPLKMPLSPGAFDPLQEQLYHDYHIEIPIINFGPNQRFIRPSCFIYNTFEQYNYLATSLTKILNI